MPYQYTSSFWILFATAVISGLIAFIVWTRRSNPASQSFRWMMSAAAFYAIVAALESSAIHLHDKLLWSKLEYVGSSGVIVFFVCFTLSFTRHQKWLTYRRRIFLWILPIFNIFLVASNEWHHLVWQGVFLEPQGNHQAVYLHGPGFYWIMICVYIYVLAGTSLLVGALLQPSTLLRRQAGILLLGAIVPLIGSSLYMLQLTPRDLNITPMSFMLTGLIYSTSIVRFRIFDLVPIARHSLIERMQDGVVVIDPQHRMIDINPAAQQLLHLDQQQVGQKIDRTLAQWPDLLQICDSAQPISATIFIQQAPPCYVEVQFSPLLDQWQRLTGQLLILRDITERQQAEVELQNANRRLLRQLEEIKTLKDQLQEQAIRDSLTGLFNRRYFETALLKELAKAQRKQQSVAILLFDIDFFKSINDTHGHQAGDYVLQALGDLLNTQTRLGDIACRYGGEEFIVALAGINIDEAITLAERIRSAFQELSIVRDQSRIQTTLSGGVALFPQHATTPDSLLNAADKALYQAKSTGRNCIQLAI